MFVWMCACIASHTISECLGGGGGGLQVSE
ncbi:unnamed protein product [Spirodela intermedia]|uniref:Uncharacterized protein n=1 Tax=Spirodela intermedia TaxID=51605 RepID=A0A7I8JQ61_SPIIN|nr:unnamed protein product [Spirodela intermedia]CAA6671572.1 unnamed protein product [Spirodela intermedia]